MIVRNGSQRLVEERLERLEGPRALDGDHRGVERCDRTKLPSRAARDGCSNWLDDVAAIRGVADNQIGERLAVDQDIVDHAPVSLATRLYWICSASRATWLVVTRSSQSRTPGPSKVSRPMWLMSKRPTRCADRLVLLDDRRVLDGHRPAAEFDQAAAVWLDASHGAGSGAAVRSTTRGPRKLGLAMTIHLIRTDREVHDSSRTAAQATIGVAPDARTDGTGCRAASRTSARGRSSELPRHRRLACVTFDDTEGSGTTGSQKDRVEGLR